MNVTLGVPRIKEIINAATKIMTPIINVPLENETDFNSALMIKGRVEKTLLGEVCKYVKEIFSREGIWLTFKLDAKTITKLYLEITAEKVRQVLKHWLGSIG